MHTEALVFTGCFCRKYVKSMNSWKRPATQWKGKRRHRRRVNRISKWVHVAPTCMTKIEILRNYRNNRNFSKICTKIAGNFRKLDENRIFSKFSKNSKFFENLDQNRKLFENSFVFRTFDIKWKFFEILEKIEIFENLHQNLTKIEIF